MCPAPWMWVTHSFLPSISEWEMSSKHTNTTFIKKIIIKIATTQFMSWRQRLHLTCTRSNQLLSGGISLLGYPGMSPNSITTTVYLIFQNPKKPLGWKPGQHQAKSTKTLLWTPLLYQYFGYGEMNPGSLTPCCWATLHSYPWVVHMLSVLNSRSSSQSKTASLHCKQLPLFEQAKAFTWWLSEVLMLSKLSCKETGEEKEQPFCEDASAPAGAITFHYSAAFFGNSPCLPLCHA